MHDLLHVNRLGILLRLIMFSDIGKISVPLTSSPPDFSDVFKVTSSAISILNLSPKIEIIRPRKVA